jgi:CubicO group peptidase (beta-lactamase class C family)
MMNPQIVLASDKPETIDFSSARLKRIDSLFQGYMDRGEIPGFIATIARKGQTVYYRKSGWIDIEADKPMQDDAIFRIASMTKPITAVAAMMLYEKGHFHLNTPISEFIPAFADTPVYAGTGPQGDIHLDDRAGDITFRHLFTHTAGLSYGNNENDPVDKIYQEMRKKMEEEGTELTTGEFGNALAQAPLAFQPGTQWRYSYSIDVLGSLIEIISGISFARFLQERIFDPLGMVDTAFCIPADKQERLATIYKYSDPDAGLQALREITPPLEMPAFTSGGGGLFSTALDYARFAQMLVNKGEFEGHRLLSPSTVELFSINQCPVEVPPINNDIFHAGYGYSLGTRVLMDVAQSGMAGSVGEFGWPGALRTFFWIDPVKDLYGLFMTQLRAQKRPGFQYQFKQLTYQAMV